MSGVNMEMIGGRETCPSATLSIIISTWTALGLNSALLGNKLASNRLRYGRAKREKVHL